MSTVKIKKTFQNVNIAKDGVIGCRLIGKVSKLVTLLIEKSPCLLYVTISTHTGLTPGILRKVVLSVLEAGN